MKKIVIYFNNKNKTIFNLNKALKYLGTEWIDKKKSDFLLYDEFKCSIWYNKDMKKFVWGTWESSFKNSRQVINFSNAGYKCIKVGDIDEN